MKYIFVTGAPGSKFSSIVRNIYYSPDIDRSDLHDTNQYYKTVDGKLVAQHFGSYFDPEQEYGTHFDRFDSFTKQELEAEFDRPFSGSGIRIIKGHVFCHHLDLINTYWPDCAIILADRPDDACFGWWVKCGNFNIEYPDFSRFKTFDNMFANIEKQNYDMRKFIEKKLPIRVYDNIDICNKLNIKLPTKKLDNLPYIQNYAAHEIKVFLYR